MSQVYYCPFNARFEKETHFAIADLLAAKYGRDKTEVVSRAIIEARDRHDPARQSIRESILSADAKVASRIRHNNEVHLIAPCGETRVFKPSGIEWLIKELEDALRECKV